MRLTLTKEQFDDLNKYMQSVGKKDISYYDQSKPTKNIVYLYGNNLYGWAMSQYLPIACVKWLTENEIEKMDLAKYKLIL